MQRRAVLDHEALAVVNRGATLGVGGTDYLVAFPQFRCCTKDKSTVLCAPRRTVADLEAAEHYTKPAQGVVDPAAAQRAMQVKSHDDSGDKKHSGS